MDGVEEEEEAVRGVEEVEAEVEAEVGAEAEVFKFEGWPPPRMVTAVGINPACVADVV